jgi:hypothetical protein
MTKRKSINASDLPKDWTPGDSTIVLNDDALALPAELLAPPKKKPAAK